MKKCKDKAPYLHSLSAVLPKALRLCLPALPSAESFHLQLTCALPCLLDARSIDDLIQHSNTKTCLWQVIKKIRKFNL